MRLVLRIKLGHVMSISLHLAVV